MILIIVIILNQYSEIGPYISFCSQGVAISILVNTGVIANVFGTTDKNDIKDISSSLQNFLICIEMFLAAIAHHYAFSHKAYVDMAADQPNCCESFCQM